MMNPTNGDNGAHFHFQLFMVSHSVVHMKRDGDTCVKIGKKREKFKFCLLSHLHMPVNLLREVGVIVGLFGKNCHPSERCEARRYPMLADDPKSTLKHTEVFKLPPTCVEYIG